MVEIPEQLECLFTASVADEEDSYSIEVPKNELDTGAISAEETYQVAILEAHHSNEDTDTDTATDTDANYQAASSSHPEPPVSKGDVREVTIESLGDRGDGIAKIDRGYVVIVPGGRPDDEVTIEIQQARANVAFAEILAQDETDESTL